VKYGIGESGPGAACAVAAAPVGADAVGGVGADAEGAVGAVAGPPEHARDIRPVSARILEVRDILEGCDIVR